MTARRRPALPALVEQLDAALADAPTLPRDAAAVALARRYAAALDATDAPALLADLGPKYAQLLAQLGMTPAGRGAYKGGAAGAAPTTPAATPEEQVLGELRDVATGRRASRR